MKRLRLLFPALAAVLLFVVAADAAAPGFETSDLRIRTPSGIFGFTVEMAVSPEQREYGLQNRPSLAPDRGMLFDFRTPVHVVMWMKNTLIPLDMVFITGTGRVHRVEEGTQPGSLTYIRSGARVRAVLELAAGTARRIGLRTGDRVLHPIFSNGHHKE
ncbi:MAG: DUF192 domain-containing protein [Hyphomicrobiales bacterium]|nr:DUF192 domain-containing protein [Hyphomicrobiales bacterium]